MLTVAARDGSGYLDFPVLRNLEITSYHIPWFLDGIVSNQKATKHLPNLTSLAIRLLPDHPNAPGLNQVLESLAKLVNLENSRYRCSDWLSTLTLNATGIKASEFVALLNSYADAHPPDARPVLPTVWDLHLQFRYMKPELEILNPLLRLFASFPSVRRLELGPISKSTLEKGRGAYWQKVRSRFPEINEVMFEVFRGHPGKMDDLVAGVYPFTLC